MKIHGGQIFQPESRMSSQPRTHHLIIKSFPISKELKRGAVNGDAHA